MLGVWARRVLVGLVLGQADEDVLELDDAAGDDGGVEPVAVVDQFILLGVGQGVGVQQPVQGCAGPARRCLRLPVLPAPHPMGLRVGVRKLTRMSTNSHRRPGT